MGGAHGHVSIGLAKAFRSLEFIVQDLPAMVSEGEKLLSQNDPSLSDRVTFMSHDINTRQPVHGADVYLFRSVMHNWPKKNCVEFLKNLIPALKPGARVLINEPYLPAPGSLGRFESGILQSLDICMMGMFNSNERTEEEYREIFGLADERFKSLGMKTLGGGCLSAIHEAVWEDTKL